MEEFDLTIIGAGIHGCGVAQLAAGLGYRTLVLEQAGIAGATSSRSSKLIHGGLRYLENGQFQLVRESIRERNTLIKIAPGLVHPLQFLIPVYDHTSRGNLLITTGLWLYRILGGFHSHTRFRHLNKKERQQLGGLRQDGLRSVLQYWDAQTSDIELTRAVMASAESMGARLRCPATFIHAQRQDDGYVVHYESPEGKHELFSRTLVNAAGPWINDALKKISPEHSVKPIDLVQGAHIIVDHPAENHVFYVEAPTDKRAIFIMPWQGKTMIGTTETFYRGDPAKVMPRQQEMDYLTETARFYFPEWKLNIVDAFAGIRVLPRGESAAFGRPRDTLLHTDPNHPRIVSIYGGKLTGYRATAVKVMEKLGDALPPASHYVDTARLPLS